MSEERETAWEERSATGESIGARTVAIALAAAALGGLGVWLYLRSNGNPQHRVSHRIDQLRKDLDEMARQLSRFAGADEGRPEAGSGS